jgi:SPP1 gp7 family putative phage head morphogenesis protein
LLARTEIIRAHAEGTLNNFELAGLENVELQAEFLTAGDDRVCPICSALSGKIYSIKEARGIIPVHPNCRCTWLPYDPEVSKLLGDRY